MELPPHPLHEKASNVGFRLLGSSVPRVAWLGSFKPSITSAARIVAAPQLVYVFTAESNEGNNPPVEGGIV